MPRKPGTEKSATKEFINTTPVNTLSSVIGFSNAVLTDYVNGVMDKAAAANTLHILETGPARHIHATIERASKTGQALSPFLGLPEASGLVDGSPVLEVGNEV